MERHEVLEMMAALKRRHATRSTLADGLKRQHPMQRIIGELLKAEIADKQARSISARCNRRQAAAGRAGRLRLHRQVRAAGLGGRRLPGQPAQRRADRRDRHRQEPSRRPIARACIRDRPGPLRRSTGWLKLARRDLVRTTWPKPEASCWFHGRLYRHRHHQPPSAGVRLRRRQVITRTTGRSSRPHQTKLALQESVLKATEEPPAARSPRWAHRNLFPASRVVGASARARACLWTPATSAVHPQRGQRPD